MPPLYELCSDGKLDEVRAALARGGDVNDKAPSGSTALMCAVREGHNSIVKLLLEQPAVKTNEKGRYDLTALHFAAWHNNVEGARMLLLHPDFNSANSTDTDGETALMWAVKLHKKEVVLELVKHESVSLDLREGAFHGRADLRLIIEVAERIRAQQVSSVAASIQSGASRLSRVSNPGANHQNGASRLSRELGRSLSLNDEDSVSKCKERCKQELGDLRKHQAERVELLLQQQEEKEQKMKRENQKKEQELKKENERALSLLLEENKSQEALMLAKHDGEERAARKAAELEIERNSSSRPSTPSQPQVPECPVCLEEMAPPTGIFQCTNGHLVCETCKTGLRPCICPECREEMTGRASGMELFLRNFQQSL